MPRTAMAVPARPVRGMPRCVSIGMWVYVGVTPDAPGVQTYHGPDPLPEPQLRRRPNEDSDRITLGHLSTRVLAATQKRGMNCLKLVIGDGHKLDPDDHPRTLLAAIAL